MKLYLRSFFIVWIALLPALGVVGQVKFTTVVNSQELGQRDYLQVQFIVENAQQIDEFDPPADFPGFHIVEGPIQSSGMSVINGNMSQYKGLSFVLQPTHTGKFTIAGATAEVDGKKMRSNNVAVTVHPGGTGAAPSNPGGFGGGFPGMQPFGPDPFGPPAPEAVDREEVLKPGENIEAKIHKNLFVKVQVDRNTCYVGEPIVATYKLYSRLDAESRVTKNPYLNGFSVYDMIDPGTDAVSVEKVNGKEFTVHTIRKAQLIPLQAGSIDLEPVEVQNTVHFIKGGAGREPHRSGDRLQDLLDQLSGDDNAGPAIDENVTLDSKPLTITVKPLPEVNKPADFDGAVGSFTIEASLANKTVAAQDEATLHVVVRGKGNLPVVTAPTVNWPAGIDAFDPTAKEDVNKSVVPMSGTKSFDYMFTARDAGHYLIPAVNLSYFDPSSQTYKTANSEPLELQVTPAARQSRPASPVAAVASASTGDRLGGFLRGLLEMILAVLFGLGVLWVWWRLNRKKNRAEPELQAMSGSVKPDAARSDAAKSVAAKPESAAPSSTAVYVPAAPAPDPLGEAREYFDNGDYKAFYREVNRALWKSIAKKVDLPSSELNKHNVIAQLELRGWDGPSIVSLENLLNECEMNLYTPAYDAYNMQQLLRQAEWVLDRLA
ncbi:MAG TPA: BatD family protein [Puia sp.]|nr:BatD family protein [Puia sp.]